MDRNKILFLSLITVAACGPPPPITSDLVKSSDDFDQHAQAFTAAAKRLIADNTCRKDDFDYMGGWLRSENEAGMYFTYCRYMTLSNKIYLDPNTGKITKNPGFRR